MKRAPLNIILLVAVVDLIGFGLIIPLQGVYAERLGASGLTFGALVGSYAAAAMLFGPLLGKWSDRIGRRRILLVSIAGSVLSHSLLGVADLVHSLPLLFLARIGDGITGANIATAQSYIADITEAKDRARGMGLFGAAFGVGFVVGPAIGAALAWMGRSVSGETGTSWPAFGAAIISLIALLLVWRYLPESRDPGKVHAPRATFFGVSGLRAIWRAPRLRELFVIVFSGTFAMVLMELPIVYMSVKLLELSESGIGLLFVYLGSMIVIVQGGLVARLVRRFTEPTLVSAGPFISACGFLLLSAVPFAPSPKIAWCLLIIGCAPVALGRGLTDPTLNTLVSRLADTNRQGFTLGLSHSLQQLARAIGPLAAGLLFDVAPQWPFWVGAILLTAIGTFATAISTRQRSALEA